MNEAKLNEMSIEELRESLEEQMNYSYNLKKEIDELTAEATEWEDRYYRLQDKWDVTIIKLENNWNELKECVKELRKYETWAEMNEAYDVVLEKMQEIESRK